MTMRAGSEPSTGHGITEPASLRERLSLSPDSLLREPARAVLSGAAVFIVVSALVPWATAQAVTGPVSFAPGQGSSDGILLIVFGSLLFVWTVRRDIAESTSRSIQLIGAVLAFTSGAVWVTAERATRDTIEQWLQAGWFGGETLIVPLTLAAICVAIVVIIWIDLRRPAELRGRTSGLRGEWQVSRGSVVQLLCGATGALLGAVGGLGLGVGLTGGWSYAALLFVILSAFGLLFGAQVGGRVGRMLVRRMGTTSQQSRLPTARR